MKQILFSLARKVAPRFTLGALALCCVLASPNAWALSDQEEEVVRKASATLNAVQSLQSRFTQVTSMGDYQEGVIYIKRPGLMRIEYDPPNPIMLLATGTWLIQVDKKLVTSAHMLLSSSPAGILLKENVDLLSGEDVLVTGVAKKPGVVEISLVMAEEPEAGGITLIFTDSPFALKQWRVTDPEGGVTDVTLYDSVVGLPLSDSLFKLEKKYQN